MVVQMPNRRPLSRELRAILNYQKSLEEMCRLLGDALREYVEKEHADSTKADGSSVRPDPR